MGPSTLLKESSLMKVSASKPYLIKSVHMTFVARLKTTGSGFSFEKVANFTPNFGVRCVKASRG